MSDGLTGSSGALTDGGLQAAVAAPMFANLVIATCAMVLAAVIGRQWRGGAITGATHHAGRLAVVCGAFGLAHLALGAGHLWPGIGLEPAAASAAAALAVIATVLLIPRPRRIPVDSGRLHPLSQPAETLATARFEALVQACAQIVWTTTPSGEIVEDSPTWRAFTGQSYDEWKGLGWLDAVHPADREVTSAAWRQAVGDESTYTVDYRLKHVSGDYRWTTARGVPLKSSSGEIIEWVGMNEDISDRKRREEHLQTLMRELSHRTKNLLAVVQSIARRSFPSDDSASDAAKTFVDRIRGLSVSHDLLVRGAWTGTTLADLVAAHLDPFRADGHSRIRIDGPPVWLKTEAAQNLGLALHELATNAAKYGALREGTDGLDIAWRTDGAGDDETLAFTWRERGVSGMASTGRAGFGRALLERVVPSALNGTSTYEIGPEGVVWTLRVASRDLRNDES